LRTVLVFLTSSRYQVRLSRKLSGHVSFHNQEIAERTRSQKELRLRNQELERLNTQLTTTKNNLESANKELERAFIDIKQLSDMLPICASCIFQEDAYFKESLNPFTVNQKYQ
jgi:predicted RNase H-like nuclease (RuvC/YqgF family)